MFTSSARGLPSAGDLAWHGPCRLATTAALAAATYAAGPPATLTANANGALAAIDGVAPAVGDRLLVKDQAAGAQNGIYKVTSLGSGAAPWVLTRATDADTAAELPAGSVTFVTAGLTNGALLWSLTTAVVNIDTTAETWTSRSAGDLAYKARVQVATSAALPASTPAVGPPGTITANANGVLGLIDGAGVVVGDRILVKDQAAAPSNGIYTVTSLGSGTTPWVLTRATDADTATELPQGSICWAYGGTISGGRYFALGSIVAILGTDVQNWSPLGSSATWIRRAYAANTTWTYPTDPTFVGLMVTCVGGGGGGGGAVATAAGQASCGSGGGGGGYAESRIAVVTLGGANQAVTVGGGGAGNAGAAGGNGVASSFGALCSAAGGIGGGVTVASAASVVALGGTGGVATVGDFVTTGSDGMACMILNAGYLPIANGGASVLGGARSAVMANNVGLAGRQYGGGGSGAGNGATQAARAGGAGAGGLVIVDEFYGGKP